MVKLGGSGSFRFRVGVSVSYSYFRCVRNFDFVYTAAVSVPLAIRGDPGKRNQWAKGTMSFFGVTYLLFHQWLCLCCDVISICVTVNNGIGNAKRRCVMELPVIQKYLIKIQRFVYVL